MKCRLLILVVTLAWAFPLAAASLQSLESIRMQVEDFIVHYDYKSDYPPRFQLGTLDSRLRLPACQQDLDISFARPNQVHGNTAILIRCPKQSGWKIHLPARIDVYADVAVNSRPLLKGQIIDQSTIKFEKQSIVRLKNGYYSRSSSLNQLQAKRNLPRGTVLTPSNLNPRLLVRSGQQVTLVLEYNGLQIRSTGQALQSASMGQTVRVRNSQSLKIVEGVVSGEAQVRVSI